MTSNGFDAAHLRYLSEQPLGTLATVAPSGVPHNKPVGFRYNDDFRTIDIFGHEMERSAKYRNVAANPQVAFTVNDVPDPAGGAAGVRFMEIRGTAEQVQLDEPPITGLSPCIIRIRPRRLVSYNVAGPSKHTADLDDTPRWR